MVNEKPVKQEKKKPAKPKKPKAQQSESSQPVTSVTTDAAPKSAVATVPGIPSVKPKRKKPGTAVKRKVQPIAVDPKGKRKGFVSVSFRKDCRPFYELHGCVVPCKGIQFSLGFRIPRHELRIPHSRYWILASLSVELGFWIPDPLSCIPDSKAQDFGFHRQNFMDSGFQNPHSLTWGQSLKLMMRQLSLYTLACGQALL